MGEGGKESESGTKGVNIGGRCARLHGYIVNVSMVRKDEKVFVSFVGWDREPTCEIGGGPLVPEDREDLGRIGGDVGDKTGTLARDKGKGRGDGRWGKLGASRRDATTQSVEVSEGGGKGKRWELAYQGRREGRDVADEVDIEGFEESGEGGGPERAMPVGDESRVRKGLEGEESSRRRDERESNWYGEGPEVGVDGLGACEEWGSCRGRVKTFDGGVGEHRKPVGANKRGDSKQRVGQGRRGKEVDRHRRQFVGEIEGARNVRGFSHG